MPMLKLVITAACLFAATVAEADAVRLSGQQIHNLVAGATVEIDTPLGSMPVRYAANGMLSGQARDLASYLGAATDSGRWWVTTDQLCHKWNRWFDAEPQCVHLRKEGRTIQWRSQDGSSGTAVIAVPAPIQAAAVPARAQAEAKTHTLAPEVPPTPASSVGVAQPTETATGVGQPSQPAEPQVAAETPATDVAVAQAPTTLAESLPQPKPQAEPLYIVANVERDDVLNVRGGPSTDFDVVGELLPDSRGVSITGACQSEWCPVQHHATSGWVNRMYLEPLSRSVGQRSASNAELLNADAAQAHRTTLRDPPYAPRTCLTPPARALLERIEEKFGPVKLVSTCRPGATIAGSGRPSRHASGNAVDFDAGSRKAEIVDWLIANHHDGGTMTYAGMNHIHVDIGPHFISIAGGQHWANWRRDTGREFPGRITRTRGDD
jgi:hypothetical protein